MKTKNKPKRSTKAQSKKTKFRATKEWKEFRKALKEEQKIDPITLSKLYKSCNCHHMDLNAEHYTDISNKEHFVILNSTSHDMVHWLYRYYIKDPDVLNRLKNILDKMKEINNDI